MQITKGKIPGAKKVVVYGPEGIGKSTFASKFPEPLFIDTEESTKDMDVQRTPAPSSWAMLLEQLDYVLAHPQLCRTLVIDTIDWAEQMCVEHVCAQHHKQGIEDFGYGNGYIYTKEELGRFLNKLSGIVKKGIHVVLTAHTQIRKFEQPDELGSYDRWELKLGKKTTSQTAPLVKEWADMMLFANYKTYSVAADDKGKKHKAQGGRRVMYTNHHPCWDAKNRYGLPDEMDFDYMGIAHIFAESNCPVSAQEKTIKTQEEAKPVQAEKETPKAIAQTESSQNRQPVKESEKEMPEGQDTGNNPDTTMQSGTVKDKKPEVNEKIPKMLRDLMLENDVGEWDIQNVVAAKGYYPSDTPIENYDLEFIKGVLVGAWPKVFGMVKEMQKTMEIPFN